MNTDTVIKVENVAKKYCKSLKRSIVYGVGDVARNILGLNSNSTTLRRDEFWVLDDVSFELKKGETLGIIGPNGAGKTTLLKLLNGIFMPDKGNVEVRGRVGALIEIGAGFHPLLTGRENIYVNGAILGMGRKEIDKKFDSIVKFADIGDFIDSPVKYYSSGMFVRLGFSIAIHSQPEILLIDEILAVGDKDFQMKCYRKICEIKEAGAMVVLISHNEYIIRETTERCLYLHAGEARFLGTSEEAISIYIKDLLEFKAASQLIAGRFSNLSRKARIMTTTFYDKERKNVAFLESGEELTIEIECIVNEELYNPIFAVNFYDTNGLVYGINSVYEGVEFGKMTERRFLIKICIPHFYLPTNNYFCSVAISEGMSDNLLDWHEMAYKLVVGRARNARGLIKLPVKWTIEGIRE